MVRFELTTYCLGGSRSNSTELHHHLPFCLMVGVGIEPTFAAFQTAANPSQLSDQISVRGRIRTFDLWFRRPTLSSSAELHEQSLGGQSGWQDSNLRRLAPKASGQPLPHTQKIKNGIGGTRTHNFRFARPAPFQFGHDPKISIGAVGLEPTTTGL